MNAAHVSAAILALNKHKFGGIIGIIAGVLVIALGGLRIIKRTAGAMMLASLGVVVLVLGILVYARKI